MSNVVMTRCDHRLIHGQVGGTWVRRLGAKKVVILCDEVYNDDFMKEMYEVSAPAGTKIEVYTVDGGVEQWKKDQFGNGNVIILFKYTIDCVHAVQAGLNVKTVNIGQSSSGKDKDGNQRSLILRAIYLSKAEGDGLRTITKENGIHVYSQGGWSESAVDVLPLLEKAGV